MKTKNQFKKKIEGRKSVLKLLFGKVFLIPLFFGYLIGSLVVGLFMGIAGLFFFPSYVPFQMIKGRFFHADSAQD